MYIVGSYALEHWLKIGIFNSKKDIDVIASESELNKLDLSFKGREQIKVGNIEYIDVNVLNNKDISTYAVEYITNDKVSGFVVNPKGLYLIKRSHIHRPLKFVSHIIHLQHLKKEAGYLNGADLNFLAERTHLTKQKYPDRVPSLNKTNEAFFDDQVTKYYVHDDIHEIMAYGPRPMYLKLKKDFGLALCQRKLWDLLSDVEKTQCVAEECRVIALERFIIPALVSGKKHMPAFMAFDKALEKVCTTLTSGYFRDYAIDNWAAVRAIQGDFLSIFHNKKEGLTRL